MNYQNAWKTVVIGLVSASMAACGQLRLRTPTAEEKKNYVFSKNIDRAVIDPNEQGPLQVIPLLANDGNEGIWQQFQRQKDLVKGDIVLADYEEDGSDPMTTGEKSQAAMITFIVIAVILVGAAIPLVYLLLK